MHDSTTQPRAARPEAARDDIAVVRMQCQDCGAHAFRVPRFLKRGSCHVCGSRHLVPAADHAA